jgi:hypothetical protein
MGQIFN